MEFYNTNKQRKIMIRHYEFPKNKASLLYEGKKFIEKLNNHPNHKDSIKFYYKLVDEQIKWIKFIGTGCVVSLASTDMVINAIKNKNKTQILEIISDYEKLIKIGKWDKNLGELNVFHNIRDKSYNSNCALIISNLIKEILK